MTPGSQQSQTCPALQGRPQLCLCLPWAQFGGIPNSRGAGLIHRSQAVGRTEGGKGGERKRNKEKKESPNYALPSVISRLHYHSLYCTVSTGPFHVLVSSELPKNANLLPMVSHHLQTKTSSAWCLRWSMLWPLPPSQAPLPGPAHLQQ